MLLLKTESTAAPAITIISENKEDEKKAETALAKIGSYPKGRELLNEIKSLSKNGRSLQIHASEKFDSSTFLYLTEEQLKKYNVDPADEKKSNLLAKQISKRKWFGLKAGEGVNVIVDFHPTQSLDVHKDGTYTFQQKGETSHIVLAHELIHGWHLMKGKHLGNTKPGENRDADLEEEFYTVGIGKYANSRITENKIRKEHGLNERKYYLQDGSM